MKAKLYYLIFLLSLAFTSQAQFSGSGSGTPEDPYIITTAVQLDEVRSYLDANFKLGNDIDLSTATGDQAGTFWNGGVGWQPIAAVTVNVLATTPFSGTLDGDGHTVSGLFINRPSQDYVGLFGYVSSAVIKNLTLANTNITGKNRTGALIGNLSHANGEVHNCHATGTVTGEGFTGGLIGQVYNGTVTESSSMATVQGTNQVGGLIGTISTSGSSLSSSFASGQVKGNLFVGGLVGALTNGSVVNTYATGDVVVNQESYTTKAGGLVGSMNSINSGGGFNPSLRYSFATGSVTFNNGDKGNGAIGRDSYAVAASQVTNVFFDLASCNVLEQFSPAEALKTSEMVVAEFLSNKLTTQGTPWVMVITESGVYPFFSWQGEAGENLQPFNMAPTDIANPTPDLATLPDLTAECSYASTPEAPTATDACGKKIDGITDTTFPITSQGTTIITWTYTSVNGQLTTQTQNIVLADVTGPTPDADTLTAVQTTCEVTELTAPTATDNCGAVVTGTTDTSLPISVQGTTVVTWTFKDQYDNSSTQQQSVIIKDDAAPVPALSELASFVAECDGQVSSIEPPTATDNCAGQITGTTTTSFPFSTVGETEITWTYDDGNGNTATQKQTIVIPQSASVAKDTTICAGSSFTFPDGTTGTATGQYVSILKTTLGCDSTITTNLIVSPSPQVSLGVANNTVQACVGQELAFGIDENNTNYQSYTVSYLNGSVTDDSLKFVFNENLAVIARTQGLSVKLEATSSAGCTASTTVALQDNTMINWGIGITQVTGATVSISNNSYPETVDSWQWDFGDGTVVENEQSPSHTYANNGDFTITLTVSNECGGESLSTSATITEACELETPSISQNGNTLNGFLDGTTSYKWIDCDTDTEILLVGNNFEFSPTESGTFAVEVTIGACSQRSECFDFVYDDSILSVGLEQSGLSIYPNPASNSLTVSLESTIRGQVNITVLSLDGKAIKNLTLEKTTERTEIALGIESLVPGIYFIRVWDNKHHKLMKFIKR